MSRWRDVCEVACRPVGRRSWRGAGLAAASFFVASAATAAVGGAWQAAGPAPLTAGQVEGIADGTVSGAVQALAPHPTNARILYIGTVNGGVWKTENATSASPSWSRLTDTQGALSIGALELDPTDPLRRTLVAGIGRFSSFQLVGGNRIGLLRSTNNGTSWTTLSGGGTLTGKNVSGLAARGATLVVSANSTDSNLLTDAGVFRSTDTGATFTQVSVGNGAATGLPGGVAFDIGGDPLRPNRLFTAMLRADELGGVNGLYRSENTGATWTKVSNAAIDALLVSGVTDNVEVAVGRHNNVYVAISVGGELGGLFRSGDGGLSWTAMDLPTTNENGLFGMNPSFQGSLHFSITADPGSATIVYVGGDRQPSALEGIDPNDFTFPNSIGAMDYTGRLFRGDASKPAGSQWVHLTHSRDLGAAGGGTFSNTAPHADCRDLAFDAAGNLLEADDGGVFKRTKPRLDTGDWFSLNTNLQIAEEVNQAFDANTETSMAGAQDVGVNYEVIPGSQRWTSLYTSDGGDVAIDDTTTFGVSTRYHSQQFLIEFRRTTWNSANQLLTNVVPSLTVLNGGTPIVPLFYSTVELNALDKQRLIIGGANGVYESFDQGDTLIEAGPGIRVNGGASDAASYGAGNNPDVLYIGSNDRMFVRHAAYPAALVQSMTYPGTGTGRLVRDVVINPKDPNEAFVADSTFVFHTVNGGGSWADVTGNLPALTSPAYFALSFVAGPFGDALVLGTRNGVFITDAASSFSTWQVLGTGLPNAVVRDLDYEAKEDALFAATMGRGVWRIDYVSQALAP